MKPGSLEFGICLFVFLTMASCAPPETQVVLQEVRFYVTATPRPSLTPTSTATPTPTHTSTPTPTPTAQPVQIRGDIRSVLLSVPTPMAAVTCGVVDVLDFPLKPPEGAGVFGGWDFGVYRDRYGGYHTGEDWGRGFRSSFGEPVFSIGTGRVTYAQPRGWGADQGVVIVRHTFLDGQSILSFYGHLDPPSVVLREGDCVARGEQIGRIGKPRSPPHLHFEIRAHMPNIPGPGYWSVDPARAGWEPPSQYIWTQRVSSSPGVLWTRPFWSPFNRELGLLGDDTFLSVEGTQMAGINTADGSLQWSRPISETVSTVTLSNGLKLVITGDQFGKLEAYPLPGSEEDLSSDPSSGSWDPIWRLQLGGVGIPRMMPLPDGGVAVALNQQLHGISEKGERKWRIPSVSPPVDWVMTGDRLIFTTGGPEASIWQISGGVPSQLDARLSGRLDKVDDRIFLLSERGLYQLIPQNGQLDLLYALPESNLAGVDLTGLEDGGLLLLQVDRFDRRLIALNSDTTLRWERSVRNLGPGAMRLVESDRHSLLMLWETDRFLGKASIFSIDSQSAIMTRIFEGGTRLPIPQDTWVTALEGDSILINIGGGNQVALDVQSALEIVLFSLAEQEP